MLARPDPKKSYVPARGLKDARGGGLAFVAHPKSTPWLKRLWLKRDIRQPMTVTGINGVDLFDVRAHRTGSLTPRHRRIRIDPILPKDK